MYVVDPYFMSIVVVVPILSHIAMFALIRRQNRNIRDHLSDKQLSASMQRERKIAHTVALITLILLILLLPNIVVLLVPSPLTLNIVFPWTTTLCLMASSLNPVIHLWRERRLSEAMKSLFDWLPSTAHQTRKTAAET